MLRVQGASDPRYDTIFFSVFRRFYVPKRVSNYRVTIGCGVYGIEGFFTPAYVLRSDMVGLCWRRDLSLSDVVPSVSRCEPYLTNTVKLVVFRALSRSVEKYLSSVDSLKKTSVREFFIRTCNGERSSLDARYVVNSDTHRCADGRGNDAGIIFLCKNHHSPDVASVSDEMARKLGIFPNYPYKTLKSLRRYRHNYGCTLPTSFSPALGFVRKWWSGRGGEMSQLPSFMIAVVARICKSFHARYVDDIVRQCFSKLDSWFFENSEQFDPVSCSLNGYIGWTTLGGPRGWSKVTVLESVLDWVGPRVDTQTARAREFESSLVREWLDGWAIDSLRTKSAKVDFRVFCTDPLQWATSGGAPAVEINFSTGIDTVRSKWAWALATLSETDEVYDVANSYRNVAQVALKEEVKTRTVITTPMGSYLRQSYLLYLLGDPKFLKSTLSDPVIVERDVVLKPSNYYVCIDASQFDHCVSKDFMIQFWERLRDAMANAHYDEQVLVLIDDEIEHLQTLVVQYDGNRIPYENGLLSGWRVTSLVGSIKSALLCEFLMKNIKELKSSDYVTQGDDIIMTCDSIPNKDEIIKLCTEFNIVVNPKKTTISPCGDFLKYRYRPDAITGLPLRTVRSIYYANPWLDQTVKRKPSEVMNGWYSFASRSVVTDGGKFPWGSFLRSAINDVRSWMGSDVPKSAFDGLLKTPVSCGGLGVIETLDRDYNTVDTVTVIEDRFDSAHDRALGIFGVRRPKSYIKNFSIRSFHEDILRSYAMSKKFVTGSAYRETLPTVADGVNMFKTCITAMQSWGFKSNMFDAISKNLLGNVDKNVRSDKFYPRYLRKTSRWYERIGYLLNGVKVSFPPSLYCDGRYDSALNKDLKSLVLSVAFTQRRLTAARLRLISYYACGFFLKTLGAVHSL